MDKPNCILSILLGIIAISCQPKADILEEVKADVLEEVKIDENEYPVERQDNAFFQPEYKTIFDKFCGYYFYVTDNYPYQGTIIKLSLGEESDYLILQDFAFAKDEIIEKEIFVLDKIKIKDSSYSNNHTLIFENSFDTEEFAGDIYVEYCSQPEEVKIIFADTPFEIKIFINNRNFFCKDYNEIPDIIYSYFSYEAQEKYTGRFIFQEQEYFSPNDKTKESQINEEDTNEIIINIKENGSLTMERIEGNKTYDYTTFFIKDKNKLIYATDPNSSGFRYSFLDDDTIIYDKWAYGYSEDEGYRYYVKYKRTDVF